MTTSEDLRRTADFALKDLRSPDDARALAAARRFRRVPALAAYSSEELKLKAGSVKWKHALDLAAIEHRAPSSSQATDTAACAAEAPHQPTPDRSLGERASQLKPPSPDALAQRVAQRVLYFAEPLGAQFGGGHRLDMERVREEALAAIRDALSIGVAGNPDRLRTLR